MKSPLKYLAGLIGRSKTAEPAQALIGQEPEPRLLTDAHETLEASVSALALPRATKTTPHQPADQSPVVEPIKDEASLETDAPDVVAIVAGSAPSASESGAQLPDDAAVALASQAHEKPAAKTRAKRITQEKTALKFDTAPDVPTSEDVHLALPSISASDEAVSLDDEITALRKQLAQKLQLQNSQLKKMLERFDRF